MGAQLTKVTDGVHVGSLFPRSLFNTVVIEGASGDVVVDAGFPWSGRRLSKLLRGRDLTEHVVTHAHGDHVGSSAWLCKHASVPLAKRVLAERVGHRLPVTRYDVAEADGTYRERYWLPFNEPVFDDAGAIVHIIRGVEEVTDSVLSSREQ